MQVLDFLEGTEQFYLLAKDVARDYNRPMSPLIFTALNESKKTINECLDTLGGIPHFFQQGTRVVYCKLLRFEGFDFENNAHIWTFDVGGGPMPSSLHLDTSAISEIREKYTQPPVL